MPASRFASLDVGSNTVRLLLAERTHKIKFRPLRVERKITRLGGNLSKTKQLDEEAMARTMEALAYFSDLLREEGVEKVWGVATGVIREAGNGQGFLDRVFQQTGLFLRLLSGEEEGRLMLQGALASLPQIHFPRLVVDIGGWSTEIIWVKGTKPQKIRSLGLGAVALCEKFLKNDPPGLQEIESMEVYIGGVLAEVREWFGREGLELSDLDSNLVGTAGTVTTLAAIHLGLKVYDPGKINGQRIDRSSLNNIYHRLRSLPIKERQSTPGPEKGREDLIVAGAAVVSGILKIFHLQALTAIDSGLLEGILLDGLSLTPSLSPKL